MSQPHWIAVLGVLLMAPLAGGPVKPRQRQVIVPIRYPATAIRLCRHR